ncbi:class I SAM-dependent methyltransferase [Chloroflexota bacterium]
MDKSEKFWDRQAGSFTNHGQGVQLADNRDFKSILNFLDINDKVLDYGCATGIISNAIADKAKEIHAIDISSKMIEIAKMKAREHNIENINYAHATIFDERFQEESFNMVLAFRVLHMLEDPRAVIRRINQLLKPDGVFISVTACMASLKALFSIPVFLLGKTGIVPEHINFFKLPELQGLMTGEGFQIVECEKMDDKVPHYCFVARKLQR